MVPTFSKVPDNLLPYIREDLRPLALGTGLVGFCLGGYRGIRTAAKRFMLESLHCTPKTRNEIVIFARQRNNRILAGFIQEGSKTGGKFIMITMFFSLINTNFGSLLPQSSKVLADTMSSGITGGIFMTLNGSVPKLYYLKRGLFIGSIAGLSLGLIRMAIE